MCALTHPGPGLTLWRHDEALASGDAVPDAGGDLSGQLLRRPAREAEQQAEVRGAGQATAHHVGRSQQAAKVDTLL